MLCPRCGQEQEDGLECVFCGVVFSRFRPRQDRPGQASSGAERPPSLWDRLVEEKLFPLQPPWNPGGWHARLVFLLCLTLWSARLLTAPLAGEALLASFLHWIHLPFHEAGHVVFSPLGEFIQILGGTLGQLLVPTVAALAFLRESNAYGASVATWWLGTSLVDCAPYIDDARRRTLPLLSGVTGQEDWEGHDWYQILSRLGALPMDHALARLFWILGALLVVASLAWAARLLWIRRRASALNF